MKNYGWGRSRVVILLSFAQGDQKVRTAVDHNVTTALFRNTVILSSDALQFNSRSLANFNSPFSVPVLYLTINGLAFCWEEMFFRGTLTNQCGYQCE